MNPFFITSLLIGCLFAFPLQASLHDEIQALIQEHDPYAHVGIMVCSLKDKNVVYEYQANKLFVPASLTKMVTSATSLHHLGANYCFETKLFHDGIISDGTLKGNLYLKGSGDPSLRSADVAELAQQLKKQGVSKASGTIFVDASVFDTVSIGPGRMLDDGDLFLSGLNINGNNKPRPALQAGTILVQKLAQVGIKAHGGIKAKKTPATAHCLATHKSEPLKNIIVPLMADSDNLYGECLFKAVGHKVSGHQGSFQSGVDATHTFLTNQLGFQSNSFIIGDGAGFSRYSLMTPQQAVRILQWAHHSPYREAFNASLAVSGVNGVLKKRLTDIPNKVRAKTGRMTGVGNLSGFFENERGESYAFSIMINNMTDLQRSSKRLAGEPLGSRHGTWNEDLQDKICRVLVRTIAH